MERSEAFTRFLESVQGGGYDHAALNACSPAERAEIDALLEAHPDGDWEVYPAERIGLVRRAMRLLIGLLCLAAVASVAWHVVALASLGSAYDAVHVPIALTIGSGLIGLVLLIGFDGKWQRIPVLLLALAALGLCGLSMRWVDSAPGGVREYWSGVELARVRLTGDLCYRIDPATFTLRGAGPARFAYRRGFWPSAFGEEDFKRYFFSDLPIRVKADGWTCVAR